MLTPQQESSLISGGDCFEHWHSADRVLSHGDLQQLQQLMVQKEVSGTYYASYNDDILLCPDGGEVVLPLAANGGEIEVVQTGTSSVLVSLTGADLIYNETSALLSDLGTALHFKAISGGWIVI